MQIDLYDLHTSKKTTNQRNKYKGLVIARSVATSQSSVLIFLRASFSGLRRRYAPRNDGNEGKILQILKFCKF